ncbi:MAG: DUF2807 domain-containing protein [Rubrivivax sp.]|nr:DUF2807 domain-containing protein [Rubrivivax sp.]
MTPTAPTLSPTRLRTLFSAPLVALGAVLALAAQPQAVQARTVGSGNVATDTRSVGEFQAVAQQGSIDVTVRQGATPSVTVSADDNLLPLVETVVESGRNGATLVVRVKRGERISTRNKLAVEIVTPKLVALASAGNGDLRVENFQTPSLKLAISGSSDARLNGLTADELGISISGSGDVRGSGQAGKLTISIAGSGDVKLPDLRADEVQVTIAGSGDAEVHAAKTLKVRIAGSGDVVYSGDATPDTSVAGSGSVRRKR